MTSAADPPLLLPDDVVFTCQQSGACCRSDWLIGVDDAAHARLRDVTWERHGPALDAGVKFVPLPFPLPGGERLTFARRSNGSCVFLAEDRRCGIHRHLGAAAKPQVCREFPYHFVQTPDGVAVGVSFACTAVRGHHGGGEPFDLETVLAVRFDASTPGIDAFLREYWRHVIFRKTLTPMHGIFRGYQTLLALYSFMKLAARLHAWRAGRPAAALPDVREAVRLVERAFVLHARYTDLFELTPLVTVLADRLYQRPSFVRTAVLDDGGPR